MAERTHSNPKTIRAVRKRQTRTPGASAAPPPEELSNYELLERRSHELEAERARGGPGTPQPPEADTPLLLQGGGAAGDAAKPHTASTRRAKPHLTRGRT